MLTADLLRARVRSGVVRPIYIDADSDELLGRAANLIERFEAGTGETREDFDEDLRDLVGDEVTFAVTRGLAKLLHDRSTWEPTCPVPAPELRRLLFERSAAHHPIVSTIGRDAVVASVADELGISPEQIEQGMYADRKSEHRLTEFRAIEPAALLNRYNLALAQGLLYRAISMTIRVAVRSPNRLRQLFRWLKFHQLMHRAERDDDGWRIEIDGPMSLFSQSQRYGLQMAKFIPALLLTDSWTMSADVRWRDNPKTLRFELTPDDGLRTHLKSRGTAVSREEKLLTAQIDEKTDWAVSSRARVIDLGGKDVLIPDFTLRSPDGREVHVEIVGFWRRSYLERRLDVLRSHGPSNLVLCVSRRMATEKSDALGELGGAVVDFAEVISLRRVMEAAQSVAK